VTRLPWLTKSFGIITNGKVRVSPNKVFVAQAFVSSFELYANSITLVDLLTAVSYV
jgi:hypothetical protein